ncbi:MAG TPA: hypothetical protein VHN14_27755 [Kofleriaceae bacterium]|jgi:hypothetical protein|nr:hypothetical protein [Kofleriaceae bacterium]
MFSVVVLAIAVGVFTMYFRHELVLRRKRRAARATQQGEPTTPTTKPS